MQPILNIGPLAVQLPGLLILFGIWVGLTLAEKQAFRRNLQADRLNTLIMIALIGGVAGSRLFYILRYPQAFFEHPTDLVSLNLGLLDPWGGLMCGVLSAWIYTNRKKMPVWQTLDILSIGLAFFTIVLDLANLASGKAYGSPSQVPWAFELWGASRHPTQVYSALAGTIIFLVIWWSVSREKIRHPGMVFLLFIALSSGSRIFLEAFRGDSVFLSGGIRAAQVVAWLVLASSLWLMNLKLKNYPILINSNQQSSDKSSSNKENGKTLEKTGENNG